MNLSIVSWNSDSTLNDGTHYRASIVAGQMFSLTGQPVYADRAEMFPYLSGFVLPPHSLTIRVLSLANPTVSAAREKLKGVFSILDFQPHALIAQDTEDSNKQYQLIGFPASLAVEPNPMGDQGGDVTFLITLAVMEPVWQAVTPTSNNWAITATGQQQTFQAKGNTYSLPKFTITPTTARTGQFLYNRWSPVYNRIANPLTNYPIDASNGGLNTSALVNFTANSNQINLVGGITAVATTIPIDTPVGAGLPTAGFGYVGTEQISWTSISGAALQGVTRGIGGTAAATHPDNAVIAQSKTLADGTDIAVQVDGALVNVWIDSPNTASTKIWIAQNWQPKQAGTLRTALPNTGTNVTVQFSVTTANLSLLKALKAARNNVFLIENEAFTYSPGNIDLVKYQITACVRAQKNTSFATHAVAVAITWIEHDIWLCYGNSAGSPLITDDTQKPLLNLNTSTNTSWVQTQFFDSSSARPAQWVGQVISSTGKTSSIFTGNQKAVADPATELGLDLLNYLAANIWKAETAVLAWSFYHPAGITTVSMAGSKYVNQLGTFPAIAGLQKGINSGNTWLTVWTEAIPGAAATWTAFTHNGQSLSGTYNNIRLALAGTISALASNEAAIQGDTVTLTLDNTKTPSVTLNAEASIYYLSSTLLNVTTGDFIIINWAMALNRTLTIDTANKTATYDDGSNAIAALQISTTRNNWLPLAAPANSGNNVLEWDDVGIANITVVVSWNDRNL